MPQSTFKYANKEIKVVWKPGSCIHSRICWTELQEVFDPTKKPWVNISGSTTEKIIDQVRKCPSGALSYIMNENTTPGEHQPEITGEPAQIVNVQVRPNGPLVINTDCRITHSDGKEEIKKGSTFLCRCGASAIKPYCDGSHKRVNFQG